MRGTLQRAWNFICIAQTDQLSNRTKLIKLCGKLWWVQSKLGLVVMVWWKVASVALVVSMSGALDTAGAATLSGRLDFETRDGGIQNSAGVFQNNATTNDYEQFKNSFGVILSTPTPGTKPLALFDSNCIGGACSGDDPDLATGPAFNSPAENLILIVNENTTTPDDNVGGEVSFRFTDLGGVEMREIIFIDLDETAATTDAITFEFTFVDNSTQVITGADFNTSASLIKTLVNPAFAGDNSYRRYSFIDASLMAVRNMDIVFGGISGGIAVLDYKRLGVVPVPAALPMLAGALGMLALLRRRRPTA